jgi:hypothetical protein
LDDLHNSSDNFDKFSIKFYILENISTKVSKIKGKAKINEKFRRKIIKVTIRE